MSAPYKPGDVVDLKGVRVLQVFDDDTIVLDLEHEDGQQLALDPSLPGNFTIERRSPDTDTANQPVGLPMEQTPTVRRAREALAKAEQLEGGAPREQLYELIGSVRFWLRMVLDQVDTRAGGEPR